MNFVRETKSIGDTFLVPPELEKFRLYTGAPIFVDFKSIPYKDVEVAEWYKRVRIARGLYRASKIDCEALREVADDYDLTHAILESAQSSAGCEILVELHTDEEYAVYRIRAR